MTENIKAVILSNIKSLLQNLFIYIGIFKISREMLLILFSVHPATWPTTSCYTNTQPKLLTKCIKVGKHSSKKKLFTQGLTPTNFEILFYILEIRLLVLKQNWADLSHAQPSPNETTYCLMNRNINISNHGVAQKEVKELRLFSQLFIVFFKSESPSAAPFAD